MQLLVTSARLPNGGRHSALLAFDIQRQSVSAFIKDPRITDPRGLAVRRDVGLLFVNGGPHRIVAINLQNTVVRDSGSLDGFDIGGANFDNDGDYCFTVRNLGTIGRVSSNLETAPTLCLPQHSVHFPRGFAFTPRGIYLASGVGPDGRGDNTIYRFTPDGKKDFRLSCRGSRTKPARSACCTERKRSRFQRNSVCESRCYNHHTGI